MPHTYGAHAVGVPALQLPVPLQVPAGVCVPAVHEATPQSAPAGYFWHAPVPRVHTPFDPHEETP